jgi:flagellar biosynthesis protein FlhG
LAADTVKKHLLSDEYGEVRGHKVSGYAEKLRIVASKYPHFVTQLALALSGRTLGLAMNQVRSQKDIDIGRSMELIGERYFGFHTRNCGHLNYDEAAWKSLRNRRLLVFDFPHSILAKKFSDLAKNILTHLGF